MKREKAHLGEAKGGWLCYDLRLAHTYKQKGERDGILQRVLRVLLCTVLLLFFYLFFILFFLQFGTKFTELYPSLFWILLGWNGDAWLCGLASGQQTLVKNTSVTSQLYSSFSRSFVFGCQWPGCMKKQLDSTPWMFLFHQLLTLWFYMMSLVITCGG